MHKKTTEEYAEVSGLGGIVFLASEQTALHSGENLVIQPGTVHITVNCGQDNLTFTARCTPPYSPGDDYPAPYPPGVEEKIKVLLAPA